MHTIEELRGLVKKAVQPQMGELLTDWWDRVARVVETVLLELLERAESLEEKGREG